MDQVQDRTHGSFAMLRPRRTFWRAASVALAVVAIVATTAAPSQAATTDHTKSYTKRWHFKSTALKRCTTIKAKGYFTYTTYTIPGGKAGSIVGWKNQKLHSPKISIKITKTGKKGVCTGTAATVAQATLAQHWTGHSCKFNPSISVYAPFAVGVGGWPTCGDRKQASYSTTYPKKRSAYSQNNSGSPVAFGNKTGSKPCYGVFPSIVIYGSSSSDSFNGTSRKVCLPA